MNGRRARAIRHLAGVKHARLADRSLWWMDLKTSTLDAWSRHRRAEAVRAARKREDSQAASGMGA